MAEITIDQKRDFYNTVCQMGLVWQDFHVIDKPDELSFKLLWLRDIRFYSFEAYYPREYKAGHIFVRFRKGSKLYHTEQTEISNLNGRFGQWLHEINKQKEFDLLTNSKTVRFSDSINTISPKFENIYIEALSAEQRNMNEISGMGFRKAFEFLIIDYLLYTQTLSSIEEAKEIKTLQAYIQLLDNEIMKKLSKYTAMCGNEFCHYFRKLPDMDISDLKEMISLFVAWVDAKECVKSIEMESEKVNEEFNLKR